MAQAGPQGITTSIPKFTGFLGKKASNPASTTLPEAGRNKQIAAPAKPSLQDNQEGDEKAKRKHHGHKHSHHEHRHRHRRRSTEDSSEPVVTKVEAWEHPPELFFVDRKGDPSNVTFGSLHTYEIPKYARNGERRVLGLSKDHKIDYGASDEKNIYTNDDLQGQSRRRDKHVFKQLVKERHIPTLVQVRPSAEQDDNRQLDYIGLSEDRLGEPTSKDATDPHIDPKITDENVNDDFRYQEGRNKTRNRSDHIPSLDASSHIQSTISEKNDLESHMRLKRASLVQKTDERPHDGQAWVDLIDYEDEILYHDRDTDTSRISVAEKRSTADIKLSIYEKSLKTVIDPIHRERLVLGMLREGSKIWEFQKSMDKWQEALRQNASYVSLWIDFLDFEQTNSAKFRASAMQQCFKDCLRILHQAAQKAKASEASRHIRILQAFVLLRSTLFLREAGWTDLSVGIWQAVLEFNLSRPERFDASDSDASSLRNSFEEFWESEVARIGEKGFTGWAAFDLEGSHMIPENSETDVNSTLSANSTWAERERVLGYRSRMPARTSDNETSDDLYRVVMFQDVAPYLVHMPFSDALEYLIPAFLLYCHMPLPFTISTQVRDWPIDPFVRNETLHPVKDQWNSWRWRSHRNQSFSEPDHSILGGPAFQLHTAFPLPNFLSSIDTLLTDNWFDIFRSWKLEYSNDEGPVPISCILLILKAVVDSPIGNDELAEYLIAFEAICSPQTVRKTAKAILKKRSMSIRLYHAYAHIEYRFGDAAKAKDILKSTISQIDQLPLASRKEVVLLWRSRTWMTIEKEGKIAAWEVLVAFSHGGSDSISANHDDSIPATTSVLRAYKAMLAMRSDLLKSHPELAITLSEMLCLMAYLNPRNESAPLDAYLTNFTTYTTDHSTLPQILELLHQSRAKLLYHHATYATSFKPSEIRTALAESIRLYPNNTMFLSLYAWNEARFRINDRVRAIVQDVVSLRPASSSASPSSSDHRTESISAHFFSIYTELSRSLVQGSNVHSVRAAFERAVDNASCGSKSAGLWKLYVLFEVNEGGGDLARAKTVFYRAMQAVPWAKDVYMMAFEELKGVMRQEELKGLVEWMVDGRALRVFGAEDF